MTTDDTRLLVRVEASTRKIENQMARLTKNIDSKSGQMSRSFRRNNRRIERSFKRIESTGSRSMRKIGALAAAAGAAFSTRQLVAYADAWTTLENKIASAEQISGVQARTLAELNDLAATSRSGLEEFGELYSRFLRVSSQVAASERDVAQATDTVSKAFKAGGAAATEQAAGILQLGQALGSGFLQGDELRSLRENAPLVAQAIADEFETTIGGLKELGAEGKLTSDRVFQAIINGQDKIEAAFATTNPTIAEGFTALRNGLIELVGAFDDGSDSSNVLAGSLQDLGKFLSNNVDRAERFGAQVSEAFKVVSEAFSAISELAFGDGVADDLEFASGAWKKYVTFVVEAIQTIVAVASAVGVAIGQAMGRAVVGVADGAVAIANTAVTAVEYILNGVLAGVQGVIEGINKVITAANTISPVTLSLVPEIENVKLDRFSGIAGDNPSRGSISDAFNAEFDRVKGGLDELEASAIGVFRRIQRAGEKNVPRFDPRGDQTSRPPKPDANPQRSIRSPVTPPSSTSGKSSGSSEKPDDLQEFLKRIELQKQALRDEAVLIGISAKNIAALKAEHELLAAARQRGLDLDRKSAQTGRTLREEIALQAQEVGRLTEVMEEYAEQAKFVDQINEDLKNGLIDAIVEGGNFSDVLQDVAKQLAKAALQATLFGEGPLAKIFGTSGGLFGKGGGLLGGLIPGFADGTNFAPGGTALVGERGPELVNLPRGSQVIPNHKIGQAGGSIAVRIVVDDDGKIGAIAEASAKRAALPIAVSVVRENNERQYQEQRR